MPVKKHLLQICLLMFSFMSCTHKNKEVLIPEGTLSKDSMIQILSDIHLAESEATLHPYNDSLGIINLPAYYKYIFEHHRIDTAVFSHSMNFYLANPELMNTVYSGVIDELSKRHARYQKNN